MYLLLGTRYSVLCTSMTPESHSMWSGSRIARGEAPGAPILPALRSSSWYMVGKSISIPAGTPSSTPPMAIPCDSPKEVKLHLSPNVFMWLLFDDSNTEFVRSISLCKGSTFF